MNQKYVFTSSALLQVILLNLSNIPDYIANTTWALRPSHGNEAELRANSELADLANFVPLVKYSLRLTFYTHAHAPPLETLIALFTLFQYNFFTNFPHRY